MSDIPRPAGDVLRRNPEGECGTPIGQLNIAVRGLSGFQTVSFYCNKSRLHQDECSFVGKDVTVRSNRGMILRP